MGERDDARGEIEQARDRMTEIVEELARRATPEYVGEQIKEKTVNKTRELRGRAAGSPTALAILGAAIGAAAGVLAGRSRLAADEARFIRGDGGDYGYGYGVGDGGYTGVERRGMKDKASETFSDVRERSREAIDSVRERSSDALESARYRATELRERSTSWASRAWSEQPLLVSAGLAVVGALAALLVPETEKERELAEPVRRKAAEGIQKLGDKIEEAVSQKEGQGGGFDSGSSGGNRDVGGDAPMTDPIIH